jgi:hypothetical protein
VVDHGGFKLIVGVGRYGDGRIGELFIDTHKAGTAIDTILRDSAILVSFALQAGIDTTTIRAALAPTGPLAAIRDTNKRRKLMREITTPADRAARVRANIDRVFDRRLFLDIDEFFDRLEDIIAEAITEHEIDVRREYSAD